MAAISNISAGDSGSNVRAKLNLLLPFFKSDGSAIVKNLLQEGQSLSDSFTSNFRNLTGTLPSNTNNNSCAELLDITTTTPANAATAPEQSGHCVRMLAGATTGNIQIMAYNSSMEAAGEGTITSFPSVGTGIRGNQAAFHQASATTTGHNIGVLGRSANGAKNWGLLGVATKADANTNIGVTGAAFCSGGLMVGGHFQLGTTFNTLESCALLADNGNQAVPIARFRDNGTTTSQVSDGGDFECLTNAIGLILVDRATAARRRILCTNGILTTEAA